jgi:PTS system fructose-specific IIA component/PTS system nitrogen regulatory IIA component
LALTWGRTRATSGERELAVKFSDFVCKDAIQSQLSALDKEAVIQELVGALIAAGQVKATEQESIVKAIMKREELGSTGIGRGVAVPHTKHPSVDRLIGTVGVSTEGVDFQSLDGEKVQLFFLLISPPDRPGDHLRALENISRQLRDDSFCRYLKQSKTAEDIQQLLEESDNNQFGS